MKVNQVKCWFFLGEGKPEYPQKTSRCRIENQQTQPTYDAESGNQTQATLVEGECSHHFAIPAPLKKREKCQLALPRELVQLKIFHSALNQTILRKIMNSLKELEMVKLDIK